MIEPVLTNMERGRPSNSCAANARRHKQIICHIKNASLRRISDGCRSPIVGLNIMDMYYSQHCTLQSRIDGD